MMKTISIILLLMINIILLINSIILDKDLENSNKENLRLTRDLDLLRNKLNKMEKKKNAKPNND